MKSIKIAFNFHQMLSNKSSLEIRFAALEIPHSSYKSRKSVAARLFKLVELTYERCKVLFCDIFVALFVKLSRLLFVDVLVAVKQ